MLCIMYAHAFPLHVRVQAMTVEDGGSGAFDSEGHSTTNITSLFHESVLQRTGWPVMQRYLVFQ